MIRKHGKHGGQNTNIEIDELTLLNLLS